MKATAYSWVHRLDVPVWYPLRESYGERGLAETWRYGSQSLRVRYDNGQTCTFKRKAAQLTNPERMR